MRLNHEYFQALDELRESFNVSVSALCEGIISERSYFRYLKSDDNISFSEFNKLLERLNVTLGQFINYTVLVRNTDNVVNKFISRVVFETFTDIEPYYQKILTLEPEDLLFDLVVKAYIKRYEYLSGKINKQEYFHELEGIRTSLLANSPLNIYSIIINVLYDELLENTAIESLQQIINTLLSLDFSLGAFYYIHALDIILDKYLLTNLISEETKLKLVNRFIQVLNHTPIKPLLMKKYFYQSYLSYINNNQVEFEELLLLYSINLITIYNGKQLQKGKEKVQKAFDYDFDEFLINASKKVFTSSLFEIKE